MTFVTVDYFNRAHSTILARLQALQNDVHATASHNQLDQAVAGIRSDIQAARADTVTANGFDFLAQALETVRADLQTMRTSLQPTQAAATIGLDDRSSQVPSDSRVFFTDLQSALGATAALLSNVPPNRYDITAGSLPQNELFGQLHALHANLLEWLRHLDAQLDNMQRQNATNFADQATRQSSDAISSSINTVISAVHQLGQQQQSCNELGPRILANLQELKDSITTADPTNALLAIARALAAMGHSSDSTTPPQNPLPEYRAVHPTLPCRTHGVLLFDSIHSRVPMDIRDSPPSTSLELRLSTKRTASESVVDFALYDAGALLLSKHLHTPHELTNLPGDALALIHQNCPKFVYKLSRYGLC